MSYLSALRLHFAGRFQAAVSTVNNDPTHFDNATFKPQYQQRQHGNDLNGWWNPRGDANWRMIGCGITSAWMDAGTPAPATDPVLACSIADSDLSVAAKLVDLDPEQQLVSEIWGLEIRIADAGGNTLLRGQYDTAAFMNIWDRWPTGKGDGMACALYQSVLTHLDWADTRASPFLTALRAASKDGLLSIKFNVDAFDMDFKSPTFTLGRVVGTIGPASAGEPRHFVIGRQFMTTGLPSGHFFAPAGQVNFCTAAVDGSLGKVYLDLGNSLPTQTLGGPFVNLGALALAVSTTDAEGNPVLAPIGGVDYLAAGWYERTAGVVELPAGRPLTAGELSAIQSNPLVITLATPGAAPTPAISESPDGVYVRADRYVFRLNPGEHAGIQLFASAFGEPYAEAQVVLYLDPSQLQGGGPAPNAGVPTTALTFPSGVTTDASGRALVWVSASDPKNPRGYIDGQVYGIRPVLTETLPMAQYPFNPWEYVSVLVWDDFHADPPVWHGCLQPVFQQYANLYPIMDRFLDLSSYDSICQNLIPLSIAFGLKDGDPNLMPVSRDLSAPKRRAILKWLKDLGPDGKPLLGVPPTVSPLGAFAAVDAAPAKGPVDPKSLGKLAAMKRRRIARRASGRSSGERG